MYEIRAPWWHGSCNLRLSFMREIEIGLNSEQNRNNGVPRACRSVLRRTVPFLLLGATAVLMMSGCATVTNTSRSFTTVVIDPGHGGHDSGASSRIGGLEKNSALDVAKRLDARLREAGFRTVMTRKSDVFIPLDERTAISNAQTNALFVSIHFNDCRNRSAQGIETYYYNSSAAPVAQRIEACLDQVPGTVSRGVKRARFRVLRNAVFPAVLVECGFLSNRSDAQRCASASYRDEVAGKIAEALVIQRFGTGAQAAQKLATLRREALRDSGG